MPACTLRSIAESSWVPVALVLGIILGYIIPLDSGSTKLRAPWDRISAVVGWTYFVAWSLSFYPQVFLNWKRRSVVGLSFDYQLLNLVGFGCYFAFNAAMFWSPEVRVSYRGHHNGTNNVVRSNDVVFSAHALLLTAVTLVQIAWYWDYPPLHEQEKPDRWLRYGVLGSLAALGVFALIFAVVVAAAPGISSWFTYVNVLAEAKVVISLFKYCPQVYMNYKRKSTVGWNIHNVLLDLMGGGLSIAQLMIDCAVTEDWKGLLGDPVKLFLGNISIIFDTIFMVQHYCLYRAARLKAAQEQQQGEEEGSPDSAKALLDAA